MAYGYIRSRLDEAFARRRIELEKMGHETVRLGDPDDAHAVRRYRHAVETALRATATETAVDADRHRKRLGAEAERLQRDVRRLQDTRQRLEDEARSLESLGDSRWQVVLYRCLYLLVIIGAVVAAAMTAQIVLPEWGWLALALAFPPCIGPSLTALWRYKALPPGRRERFAARLGMAGICLFPVFVIAFALARTVWDARLGGESLSVAGVAEQAAPQWTLAVDVWAKYAAFAVVMLSEAAFTGAAAIHIEKLSDPRKRLAGLAQASATTQADITALDKRLREIDETQDELADPESVTRAWARDTENALVHVFEMERHHARQDALARITSLPTGVLRDLSAVAERLAAEQRQQTKPKGKKE